jgi:hypothetical protein
MIRQLYDQLKSIVGRDELKRLRRSPEDGIGDWLSSSAGMKLVFDGLKARGASTEDAALLTMKPSVSAAFTATLLGLGLYWLIVGGLDSAPPEQSTNDLHDTEYAVLGSLSVDLLSNDKRLLRVFRAVTVSSQKRQERLQQVYAFGESQ